MRIIIDADLVLEYLVNRSSFVDAVQDLSKVIESDGIELYLSRLGLEKIRNTIKVLNGISASKAAVLGIKKIFKILSVPKSVSQKARLSSASDFESAIEIALAIKANISAIVTHKPSDFSEDELKNIITLTDVQQRQCLEKNFLEHMYNNALPAVLVINSELIFDLNKTLYHLPSYINSTPSKSKKLNCQLPIKQSQDRASSPLDENLSSNDKIIRSIKDNFDSLFSNEKNTPEIARKGSINDWQESLRTSRQVISALSEGTLSQYRIGSSIHSIDGASADWKNYKASLADLRKNVFGVDSLSLSTNIFPPESRFTRSMNPELLASKNHHNDWMKNIFEAERSTRLSAAASSLLSSKSALARPIGLVAAENHLKTLKEDFDRLNKLGSSFIDNISSQSLAIQSIDWMKTSRIGQSVAEVARPIQLPGSTIDWVKTSRIGQSVAEAARLIQLPASAIDSLSTQSIVACASGTIGSLNVAYLANNPLNNLMKNVVEAAQSSQLSTTAIYRASSQLIAAHPIESIDRLKPGRYQPQLARSNGQVNVLASALSTDKIRLGDGLIAESISRAGLVKSSLSEREIVARSGLSGDGKAHPGLKVEPSSHDPYGLLAQTKLLESISRIGSLETTLSRRL